MQRCSGAVTAATGNVGEGNYEDNYEEGIIGEETVGEEETNSLDGSSST